jgi:hypothetical protein
MEIVEETILKAQFHRERQLIGSIMVLCSLCFSAATVGHCIYFWHNSNAHHLLGASLCSSVLFLIVGMRKLEKITFEQWLEDERDHEKGP